MKLRIVLSLVCLLLFLEGCSPKSDAAPTPSAEARKPPAGTGTAPAPSVSVPAAAPTGVAVPAPAPAPAGTPVPAVPVRRFDESLLRGREFLLEAASSRQFVRDPDLGPLGSAPAVTKAVEAFFRDALDGKLEADTLVPRWAAYLQSWAKRYRLSGDGEGKTVRVGEGLTGDEGLLMVPVRLTGGAKAPLQGWLALVGKGETWLVSDVQVVEAVPKTGPYDPESTPQEISSPSLR